MKKVFLILSIISLCFAVDKSTKPYTFSPSTTIRSSYVNANFDSIYNRLDVMTDTLNKAKDSLFNRVTRSRKMNVDSTMTVDSMNARTMRGIKITLDSTATIDSVKIRSSRLTKMKVDSTVTVDSLFARAIGGIDTTFPCSLFDGATYRARANTRAVSNGRIVVLTLGALSGQITIGSSTTFRILPVMLRPPVNQLCVGSIIDTTFKIGHIGVGSNGVITILTSAQGQLGTYGTSGGGGCTVTYFK